MSFREKTARANVIMIAYLVLFSFVLAQIANYTMRVIYYRRGF